MGCSSSPPAQTYNVSYCSLTPIQDKPNTFKIILLAEEEIQKIEGEKFLNQCGGNNEENIIQFLDRKEFQTNTIFYFFLKKEPIIKNLNQTLPFQPFNSSKLFKIILLSTESAKPFSNLMIEKKTKNMTYFKFIGEEIDLDEMIKFDEENASNLTEDDKSLIEEDEKETNEENKEKENEINITNLLNKNNLEIIKNKFKEENNTGDSDNFIKSVKIFSLDIADISTFIQLISFLGVQKIKKFAFFENNVNNDFEGWESIFDLLDNNYSIRYLDMNTSNIDDNNLYYIARSLSDKRIKYLNLKKNFISLEGTRILSELLKYNRTLQILNLSLNSHNHFKSDGVKIILGSLINNPNFKIIDFSYMNLTGCGEHIGNFISNCKSIEKIIIKNVQLNTIDFKNIFENVKTSQMIKEIDISMNNMGGDKSLEYISAGIKENKSLNTLKMDKINIKNDNYKIIFDGIENNKNISCYSLNYNSNINPKIVLDFFFRQNQVKALYYHPYDKNNKEDKKKELSLEDKKMFEKLKNERPDMKIIH